MINRILVRKYLRTVISAFLLVRAGIVCLCAWVRVWVVSLSGYGAIQNHP